MYSIGDKFENKNNDIIEIVAKVYDDFMSEYVYMVKITEDVDGEKFVRFTVFNDNTFQLSKKIE